MKRVSVFLLLFLLNMAFLSFFSPLVFASTDLDLNVNSDDGTQTQWTRVGSTPYLDIQDDPINYVHVSDKNKKVGDFSFEDYVEPNQLRGVDLYVYCDAGTEKINAYLWDGLSWSSAYEFTGNGYAWRSFNVSSFLDSETKVNATKIYFESKGVGAWSGTVKIDACYLQVNAWFNSSWGYRKSHLINNSTGAGTNYQVRIRTHYGSGTDSGNEVYLNNHSQTDFDDIRFTENNGIDPLDYWRDYYDPSNYSDFWVEIAGNLNTTNQTIYIYYGTIEVSTTSNGTNTFLWFDDFEPYTLGDLNGQGGWVTQPQPDVVNDEVKVEAQAIRQDVEAGGGGNINVTIPDSFALRWYMWGNEKRRVHMIAQDVSDNREFGVLLGKNDHPILYIQDGSWFDSGETYSDNTWYNVEVASNGSSQIMKIFLDNVLIATDTSSTHSPLTNLYIGMGFDNFGSEYARWDAMLLRKYVDPEPIHGGWGNEEISLKTVTFYNTTGGILRLNGVTIANGTSELYISNTIIELIAIVEGNGTYVFLNYTWDSNSNVSNPSLLTVTDDLTIWAYFSTADEVAGYGGFVFLFFGLVVGFLIGALVGFGSKTR